MEPILKSDIFFVIASAATAVVTVILVIAGFYIISVLKTIKDIIKKAHRVASFIEEDSEGIHKRFRKTWLYKKLFGKVPSRTKSKENSTS